MKALVSRGRCELPAIFRVTLMTTRVPQICGLANPPNVTLEVTQKLAFFFLPQ